MGFFDGNTLSSRATAQLSYDGGFDVADKKLRHGLRMLSMISSVKLKQCEAGTISGSLGMSVDCIGRLRNREHQLAILSSE